jgi:hypothetical protein
MIIPTPFGMASPLWRTPAVLQTWALGRLGPCDLMFVDLRLALAAVFTRLLVRASDAVLRHVMGRAWQGARFAQDITAAATMVAAAWR